MIDKVMVLGGPIEYNEAQLKKIRQFEIIPDDAKHGSFWGGASDEELNSLKKAIKDHYLKVQEFKCAYCRQQIFVKHNAAWDVDHVVSKDVHPQFMFESLNLCISCKDCNGIKSNKSVLLNKRRKRFPGSASDYDFVHPHFHVYSDHVRVVKLAALYLPKTALGVKLIEVCGLLRFVLEFAGYDCAGDEIGSLMIALATELQESKSAVERVAVMNIMKMHIDEGLRELARSAIRGNI